MNIFKSFKTLKTVNDASVLGQLNITIYYVK